MPFIPALFPQFGETVATDRFVGVLRTEHHLFLVAGQAVRMVRQVAAPYADGVYFGYVLRRSHQRRHRSEGLAREVHVEARHDYPHPAVGQLPADLHSVPGRRTAPRRCPRHRRPRSSAGCSAPNLPAWSGSRWHRAKRPPLRVSHVDAGFEDFDPQAGEFGSLQAADQLLGFTREHRAAYHFDPTFLAGIFQNILLLLCFVSLFRASVGRYSSTRVIRAPRALRRPSMSL